MRPVLYVHAGSHKTGTTALQWFLNANYARLVGQGLLYPESLRPSASHDPRPEPARCRAHHDLAWVLGFGSVGQRGREVWPPGHDFGEALAQELHSRACTKALISSEVFEENCSLEKLRKLRAAFSDFDTRIVYYVRRQDHLVLSAVGGDPGRLAQGGNPNRLAHDLRAFAARRSVDYYDLLAPFAEVFGRDSVRVRVYEREQLPNGLMADFLGALGLGWSKEYVLPPRTHSKVSLPLSSLDVVRICRSVLDQADLNSLTRLLTDLAIQSRQEMAAHPEQLLSPQERVALLERFEESNRKVAREYLGRQDGRLFYERWPDPTEPFRPYPGPTLETVLPVLARLLVGQGQKLAAQARKLSAQEARIAALEQRLGQPPKSEPDTS